MKQDIIIKEALNQKDYLAFVKFPFELFKNNPYWVPPLIKDELETIDPSSQGDDAYTFEYSLVGDSKNKQKGTIQKIK